MAVTAVSARPAVPFISDIRYTTANATGTVNVGDMVSYTGQFVEPDYILANAYSRASAAGIAMEACPIIDQAGRSTPTGNILIMWQGILHVSASFSGQPLLGLGAYPDATGSAVGGVTGLTGVGATWNTAAIRLHSADPTAAAAPLTIGTVIGSTNFSNAGTGELFIRFGGLDPAVR